MRLFQYLIITVLLATNCPLWSQIVQGTIVEKGSGKPIAYSNIGIYGKSRGTVSDERGKFHLDISSFSDRDTLRISVVGYERRDFALQQVRQLCASTCQIELTPKEYNLSEVVISSSKNVKERMVGNNISRTNVRVGMADSILGYEFGTVMRVKRKPAQIQEVIMHIASCDYDSVFLRMNIHSVKNGIPDENLLHTPIYVQFTKEQAKQPIRIDMAPYHVKVQDDFVVSFEVVRELGTGGLYLTGSLINKDKTLYRSTSQAKWSVLGPIGVGIAARILQEK